MLSGGGAVIAGHRVRRRQVHMQLCNMAEAGIVDNDGRRQCMSLTASLHIEEKGKNLKKHQYLSTSHNIHCALPRPFPVRCRR